MRTLFLSLLIFVSLYDEVLTAQLCNTNTYTFASSFPSVLYFADHNTFNPDSNQCWQVGWRTIASTQSPSNGYSACTPYAISTGTNTWTCSLVITQQCSIQNGLDASLTNQTTWSLFNLNASKYRVLMRAYNGNGAETNLPVAQQSMLYFINTNHTVITTLSNFNDFIFIYQTTPDLLRWSSNNTTTGFWKQYGRLIQ